MNVLIADPNAASAQTLSALVERSGHSVVHARSPGEMVDALVGRDAETDAGPDVVLADFAWQREALNALPQNGTSHYPTLAWMVDNDTNHNRARCTLADDCLLRPFDEAELDARLRVFERRAMSRKALLERLRVVEAQSLTDPLTQIANRRRFDEEIDKEWRRAVRAQSLLAIVMVDIDHFKEFNDRYGHQGGDSCLRVVAQSLDRTVRRGGDMVARYGGEEFAAILPNTDPDGARFVAESMRAWIEALPVEVGAHGDHASVTISVGVAAMRPTSGSEVSTLIERADRALYRAKEAGRNRVESDTDDAPDE